MHLKDRRGSALARHNDQALDSAFVLIALVRQSASKFDTATFGPHIDMRIIIEIRNFCLNARNAIEIMGSSEPDFMAEAKADGQADQCIETKNDEPARVYCSTTSFWWSISRIIDSPEVMVYKVYENSAGMGCIFYRRYLQFNFEAGANLGSFFGEFRRSFTHIIHIEGFVKRYLPLGAKISRFLKTNGHIP